MRTNVRTSASIIVLNESMATRTTIRKYVPPMHPAMISPHFG